MDIRIVLNGKKAGLDEVRSAVYSARENGQVEVRTTWEAGDLSRLVKEACAEGCQRLVAGGGDGTVNEAVSALLQIPADERPELAILPLGTANDFASACGIPADPLAALKLAQSGRSCFIDAVKANEFHFINVASGGFGAFITANTPPALKNFFGGGAYTLYGLIHALDFVAHDGELRLPGETLKNQFSVGAVCNGRQAGGDQQLAPGALIDDGLLDIVGLVSFPANATAQVLRELKTPEISGDYVKRFRVPWAEWESDVDLPVNLDGEPITAKKIRFEVLPGAIKLVLPENCSMTKHCP